MLILQPMIHETIWGGDLLSSYYDSKYQRIGHLYSCCPMPGHSNMIANGKYQGRYLYDYLSDRGKAKTDLQFLIAIVTPWEDLSIQVHPSFGPNIKNESWYFIKKPESSAIYNGCKTCDKSVIRQAMVDNDPFKIVDLLTIEDGDYVYVQAGTLHALTAGSVVYEIEELGGDTYRFYDYNRVDADGKVRELQLDAAMEHLICNSRSSADRLESEKQERKYTLTMINGGIHTNTSNKLECLTLISGSDGNGILKFGMSTILECNETYDLGKGCYIIAR